MTGRERVFFEKRISDCLAVTAAFLPLVFVPFGWDRYYLPKAVCLYGVCLWMLALCLRFRQPPIMRRVLRIRRAPAALLAGFILWTVLSVFFSIDPLLSVGGSVWRMEGVFTLAGYGLLLLFAMGCYRYRPLHGRIYLAAASLCAFYGVLQRYGLECLPIDDRRAQWENYAFATSGNPNFFGSFLALALPVAGWAFVRKGSVASFSALTVLCYALFCSETQGAWIGAAVSFLLLAAVFVLKSSREEKLRLLRAALLAFALAVLYEAQFHTVLYEICSVFSDFAKLIGYAAGNGSYTDAAGGGKYRVFIWGCALQLIRLRPFFGFGPECMREAIAGWLRVDFREDLAAVLDRAHNEYLHTAVSSGIPAAVFYIGLIALALREGTRAASLRDERLALTCAAVGYATQAFFNISTLSAAPVFWIFLGVLLRGGDAMERQE